MKQVPELVDGLNLPKHMAEHFYMFSGESVPITLRTTSNMMSELVDWFGKDFRIIEKNGEEITVRLTCNYDAMRYWALQYGPYVEIVSPESLRSRLKEDAESMLKKYSK